MNQSQSIGNLAGALATVQANLSPAKFNAVNPFFKSKYADLGSIFDACRQLLADNGLSVSQLPSTPPFEFGPSVALTTILMHESGEWISDTLVMPLAKPTPQDAGSALTYARRYALAAIVGIVTDEDGNGASHKPAPPKPAAKQSTAPPATVVVGHNPGPDPRDKPGPQPGGLFRPGDDVIVKGKNDEKPGVVKAVNGLITVEVDGKFLELAADKLKLVGG